MQWLNWRDRLLLIDGAHNPAGAEMLRHYVDHSDRVSHPVRWVIGMLKTKDHEDIFKALLRSGDSLYLVPVPDHLSADLEPLVTLATTVCPGLKECNVYDDVMAGLEASVRENERNSTIVLCGSLYLIGHFFKLTAVETQH
ncbi:MAG: hypothetical protein HC769_19935 [Cyanobacteria bacterium CRU_2_1]|nr:hypothetical protein [Cyanobacteria bacterium CRU_2_1]